MKKNAGRNGPIIIVGAGAAGMMAACAAAARGAKVLVLEKNEKAGKKIYITGKGRCNFTNLCDTEDFFSNVPRSASFLYSSVYGFDAHAVRDWFEEHGVRTKEERGQRAFPLSDHASDITRCLVREMERLGVEVWLNTEVKEILFSSSPPEGAAEDMPHGSGKKVVEGVLLADGRKLFSGCVIIATGGLSYPSTGSTGDGYRFARSAGHEVSRLSPSLVPFEVKEKDVIDMQGLSLKNVTFTVAGKKKNLFHEMGELMFTHFGITGPLILKASALVQEEIAQGALPAWIDLKPALTEPKLDARILRDFEENRNRSAQNAVRGLYPSKLIPVILKRAGIDPDTPVHDVTAAARRSLVQATKRFDLTLTCLRGFNEAVITRGGVNVRQVDPGTMESKLVKGLYFAGEVLDVDAFTGGFNLQIAWSTGRAAGDAGGTEYGI
jgi:predicted Rossmann fold flavoprotein